MGVNAERGPKRDSSPEARTTRRAADEQKPKYGSSRNTSMRKPPSIRSPAEKKPDHKQQGCGKGESFVITSRSFPMSGGCYKPLKEYNGEAMYSPSQENRSNDYSYVVGATQGGKEDPNDIRWSLIYADSGNSKESLSLCRSVQSATTTHPANALWFCDLSGNGVHTIVSRNNFSVSCGCSSPDPAHASARLVPPPPPLRPREFWCGIILGFGIISLCWLYIKLIGGRKMFWQQGCKCVRVGAAEDPL